MHLPKLDAKKFLRTKSAAVKLTGKDLLMPLIILGRGYASGKRLVFMIKKAQAQKKKRVILSSQCQLVQTQKD